jgi:hypothetical protein
MPFNVDVQPGEELYLLREFHGSHGHVFAMAVSNQAIYLPAQRMTLKADSWYFKRIPLTEVTEVSLAKAKPIYIYLLSLVMIVSGALMTYLMMAPRLRGEPGKVSGWPIAILVGGVLIPFIARGRNTLSVKMSKGRYKWKPQLAVDKKTREAASELQKEILQACKKAGIRTLQSD